MMNQLLHDRRFWTGLVGLAILVISLIIIVLVLVIVSGL